MGYNFTQKQCIKALLKIGFTDASKRRGKHFKYKPPQKYFNNYNGNIKPFITVPKHKFFCQDAIVSEIGKLCGKEMEQKFLENL
ncbi:hypothetical protein COV49_03775 [Candidatus Falkowbacteria bacterium CG11_big_fil_rev_8_21_14_0_20_39_10]|uniref:Type II toxin-antitoxin system HicA family toxin n=1 Tax=Candidatus Falkowbacteria bacterium CG11_big_fil_rev_8_21_14_0_20_39_10 TaxID=1974570 RepID=A0A2M6K874_9BACT|nr:MAG: hypothetical protein COV49_03775 [Candidatus Falkowbacteria bacterium CG11_big_fil_rev_8_21_14_0_20_39_10]